MCEALTCIFTTCKRFVEGDTGLCYDHQDFYNPETWCKNWLTHPNRGYVVLRGHQEGSAMRNLEDHIRYATQEKVRVPEAFIRSIPALPKYTDLYLLLCENDYVDPTWNKNLLNQCFVEFLKRRKMVFSDYWPNIHEYFYSLLTNEHMGPTSFFFKFFTVLYKLRKQSEINPYHADIDYKKVVDEYFNPEDPDIISGIFDLCCLASKEFLAKAARCKDEPSKQYFYTVAYPYFQAKKASVRQKCKEEGDDLKREIVEVVYHPRNVEKWLETGGWELLEMMC